MWKRKSKNGFTLIEMMIVVAILGILAALVIPNFVSARKNTQGAACVNTLGQIYKAKEQWALENKKTQTDTPTAQDLMIYVNFGTDTGPLTSDVIYGAITIGNVGTPPFVANPTAQTPACYHASVNH